MIRDGDMCVFLLLEIIILLLISVSFGYDLIKSLFVFNVVEKLWVDDR